MTGYQSKRAMAQDNLDSMERKALKLAQQVMESLPGFRADIDNALDAIKEALARPDTSPPAQRKRLTDKQILADETLRYYFGQNGGAGPVSKQGRKVVDAIEAAHGIKENT